MEEFYDDVTCRKLEEDGVPDGKEVFFLPNLYLWMLDHTDGFNIELSEERFLSIRGSCPAFLMDCKDVKVMEAERGGMPNDFSLADWNRWLNEEEKS